MASAVVSWLADNTGALDAAAQTLAAFTQQDSASERNALVRWAVEEAPGLISDIATDSQYQSADLSERLAEAGLLPMLGFPTQQRLLHLRSPSGRNWPPPSVNRDAALAVVSFAPGSEIVKDKGVYTSVGFASYRHAGGNTIAEDNPLGHEQNLSACSECGGLWLEHNDADSCPNCGATWNSDSTTGYREFIAVMPRGYRTTYRQPADFQGWLEWTPTSGRARLATPPLEARQVGKARSGAARRPSTSSMTTAASSTTSHPRSVAGMAGST